LGKKYGQNDLLHNEITWHFVGDKVPQLLRQQKVDRPNTFHRQWPVENIFNSRSYVSQSTCSIRNIVTLYTKINEYNRWPQCTLDVLLDDLTFAFLASFFNSDLNAKEYIYIYMGPFTGARFLARFSPFEGCERVNQSQMRR
jgi:hypothetical protein